MKKSLRDAEIVSMLEIALLPVFLYTYTPNKLIFWILIISFDSFALKKLDVEGLLPMMTSKEEMKTSSVSGNILYRLSGGNGF